MKYYIKTEANDRGDHVVHREDCQFLPNEEGRKALGDAASCETAMNRAQDEFSSAKACSTCCSDCA